MSTTLDTRLEDIGYDDADGIDDTLIDTRIAGDEERKQAWDRCVRTDEDATVKDLRDALYARSEGRYEVYVIHDGEGIDALHGPAGGRRPLCACDDRDAIYMAVETLAYEYSRGVAIVDTDEHTIDWGSDVTDYRGTPYRVDTIWTDPDTDIQYDRHGKITYDPEGVLPEGSTADIGGENPMYPLDDPRFEAALVEAEAER